MTLELNVLLAGPRGRRLCLEFALRTTWDSAYSDAEELRQAIFLAPMISILAAEHRMCCSAQVPNGFRHPLLHLKI